MIATLPFVGGQDAASLEAAPTGTLYPSTCDATQYHAVWYRYTPTASQTLLALNVQGVTGLGNYAPQVSIWTGTPGALTQYQIVGLSETQSFCGDLSGDAYFQVPVTPFTTYYVQVTDANNTGPLGDDLLVRLVAFAYAPTYPAGECADTVASGVWCCQDGEADTDVVVLNADLSRRASVSFAPAFVNQIKSNRTDTFYVVTHPNGGGVGTIHAVDLSGNIVDTWTLPADSITAKVGAVARDGSVFYYGSKAAGAAVHAYDLVARTALSDLTAGFTTEFLQGLSDGYVASDGTILLAYTDDGSGQTVRIRRFNPNGSVNHTYTIAGGLNYFNHFAFADDTPGSFWVWGYGGLSQQNAIFQRVDLTSAAVIATVDSVPVMGTSGYSGQANAPFSISNSCPLVILPVPVPIPDTISSSPPTTFPAGSILINDDSDGFPAMLLTSSSASGNAVFLLNTPTTVVPAPDLPTVVRTIRRMRTAPHLWDGASAHRLRYPGFQLLVESGVEVPDAGPLTFTLQWSDDGGHTWSHLHTIAGAKIGQYRYRFWWHNLGVSRDRVFRVIDDNDAVSTIIDALLVPDPIEGAN